MINSKFCFASHYSRDMEYCDKCNNCHNCFGCDGIQKGEYVIFNKKFVEKDYFELKNKIIVHMKKTGEYGEFFPIGSSGFKYEETIAQEYYPKKQIINKENKIIPNLLVCLKCQKNFRIIQQEKDFYVQQNIPIPKICPECRHQRRNQRAGERTLYDRKCVKCDKKVNSTYEIRGVYCEECYNKEIY